MQRKRLKDLALGKVQGIKIPERPNTAPNKKRSKANGEITKLKVNPQVGLKEANNVHLNKENGHSHADSALSTIPRRKRHFRDPDSKEFNPFEGIKISTQNNGIVLEGLIPQRDEERITVTTIDRHQKFIKAIQNPTTNMQNFNTRKSVEPEPKIIENEETEKDLPHRLVSKKEAIDEVPPSKAEDPKRSHGILKNNKRLKESVDSLSDVDSLSSEYTKNHEVRLVRPPQKDQTTLVPVEIDNTEKPRVQVLELDSQPLSYKSESLVNGFSSSKNMGSLSANGGNIKSSVRKLSSIVHHNRLNYGSNKQQLPEANNLSGKSHSSNDDSLDDLPRRSKLRPAQYLEDASNRGERKRVSHSVHFADETDAFQSNSHLEMPYAYRKNYNSNKTASKQRMKDQVVCLASGDDESEDFIAPKKNPKNNTQRLAQQGSLLIKPSKSDLNDTLLYDTMTSMELKERYNELAQRDLEKDSKVSIDPIIPTSFVHNEPLLEPRGFIRPPQALDQPEERIYRPQIVPKRTVKHEKQKRSRSISHEDKSTVDIWTSCLQKANLNNDFDGAYREILATGRFDIGFIKINLYLCIGDDIYLLRLINITGPCLKQLQKQTARELIRRLILIMKSSFIEKLSVSFLESSNQTGIIHGMQSSDQKVLMQALYRMIGSSSSLGKKSANLYSKLQG